MPNLELLVCAAGCSGSNRLEARSEAGLSLGSSHFVFCFHSSNNIRNFIEQKFVRKDSTRH